jgi:adenosine deaminase
MSAAGLTKDDYIHAILDILNAHNEDTSSTMRAYLILSVDRRNTIAEAGEVVDLAIKYQSSGVVALDLCGDPAKGDVRIFASAFARAKAAGLKITLHYAETESSATDLELQEIIKRENIGLELCLSCNVHAKMITGSYSDHHFGIWRHSNVPVAICVWTACSSP